jgi:gamma-glutamyltranspeptidase
LPDLAEHQSKWEEPLCATYRGNEVTVPPPNSYELLLLLQLKILANHDQTKDRHETAEYLWLQLESRISENVSRRLVKEGYKVSVCGPWEFAFGGVEAICLHENGKVFMAAAYSRRDGYAFVLSRCGIRVSTCVLAFSFDFLLNQM